MNNDITPDVSIVLPVYNGEKYLLEAIDSIIRQTYQHWELIAVDDCSTDGTLNTLKECAERDSRIHVIHNDVNKKLPATLNVGFKSTVGKYLTWTSDDNRYHETAIEKLVSILNDKPEVALAYAAMNFIDADDNKQTLRWTYTPDMISLCNTVGACFMYRREVLVEIGEYNTDLFGVEDYDYWLRIAERYPIMHIPEILYDYRLHSGSLTESKRDMIARQRCKLREQHIEFIISDLEKRPNELLRLYFNYLGESNDLNSIVTKRILQIPYFQGIQLGLPSRDVIVFGAGKIGGFAKNVLGNQAVAFVDNDKRKIGTVKQGIPIISFDDMVGRFNQNDIVIAMEENSIIEVIDQLSSSGANRYYIYQMLINHYNQNELV